jgi:hypothetical protein
MSGAGDYLTVWIPVSSWLDADGVRHDVPRHLIGVSTPYVRGRRPTCAADAPIDVWDVFAELDALRARHARGSER